jgi:protein arginine kinase activator
MGMSSLAHNMSIFGAMDTLSDFFGMLSAKTEQRPNTVVACDQCGTTYSEFKKTLYVGCQHCYSVFMEPMLPILKGLQNSTNHVGKIPKGMEHVQEYHNIQAQLKTAVAEERYEDAIALRERLKQLQQ